MTDPKSATLARSISFDFDGVLATLVLARRWTKTRKKKRPVSLVTPLLRVLRIGVESFIEGLRKPYPKAAAALRRLRAFDRILFVVSSRTDERIAFAEHWLECYALRELFERLYFNVDADDADAFKAAALRANSIDIHVDDDPGTISYLASLFPDKLFVYLDHRRRGGAEGDNIIVVHTWDEIPPLFASAGPI